MALSTPNYVAQSFDQDQWIARDRSLSGREALDAFLALGTMNRALFGSLTPAERADCAPRTRNTARLTVDWIIHQMAGHQIHHLKQLDDIAAR